MMIRALLVAAAILVPSVAATQDAATTGSIPPAVDPGSMSEGQVRSMLARAGYAAIGTLERDAEGVWRTTAMKGFDMMAVAVTRDGEIEDR